MGNVLIHLATIVTRFLTLALSLILSIPVFSQVQRIIRPTNTEISFRGIRLQSAQPAGRPKVGLVLSGGGGRGLAQIGVLRALERHHIPIDLIVGNSLGSVIGGLYASGYTITEIESIATHTNWNDLLSFSEETKRTDLFVGQKQLQQDGYLLIRFNGLEPIIPSSVSSGQRLSNFFSYLSLQALYQPFPSFDDLKVPFRAVATDLLSGRRIILDHGSVAEAMRASVTVPLLYSPLVKDSMYMVDGGLMSNIPADVARSLGCDVVIIVNSTSSMRGADQLGNPWEIADQIMTIMMQESNQRQLLLGDIVLTPPGRNRIVSDFTGVDTLIDTGERITEANIPKILNIIRTKTKVSTFPPADSLRYGMVTFRGDSVVDELRQEIIRDAQAQSLSSNSITEYLNRIYASGEYREVYAELSSNPPRVSYHTSFNPPVGEVRFSGNHILADSLIRREMFSGMSARLNCGEIENSFEKILQLYRNRGYSLARIESVQVDHQHGEISFHVNEGIIYQIRYEGNVRTRDYVIRREFPLDEGDLFNIDEAYQGIVNIKSTGLFDYVLLDVTYENGKSVLILRVREKSSELLRFGFHVDEEHGAVSTVDVRDANFRGAWEDLGLILRYGNRDRGAIAAYSVNRIFNTYLTLNLKTYFRSRDVFTYTDALAQPTNQWERVEDGKYRESRYGWSLAFGSHFERLGDVIAELRWENQTIGGLSGQGYLPERNRFVALRLQSIVDTENKFWFPTDGMLFSFTYESAAKSLGSETGFGKVGILYETFLTPLRRHTIRPRITFGFADQTLPIAEQFSLGGFNSFYGLREDDSRGRQLFLINLEYRFLMPFKIIFDTYVKARYDFGMISLIPQELKLNNFRHGIGAEVALDTPLGQTSFGLGKSFFFRQDLPSSPITVGPLLFYFSVGPTL